VLSEELISLTCPTTEGQITILPGHAQLIATLVSGELTAKSESEEHFIHVAGGFVQVKENSHIIILADMAEHFYEIDLARAEQAKIDAEAALAKQQMSDEEYAITFGLLQRNLSRINIARKHSHRRTNITQEGVFHS
jgi:F-type H+-transporting ATPase subunit epsilon